MLVTDDWLVAACGCDEDVRRPAAAVVTCSTRDSLGAAVKQVVEKRLLHAEGDLPRHVTVPRAAGSSQTAGCGLLAGPSKLWTTTRGGGVAASGRKRFVHIRLACSSLISGPGHSTCRTPSMHQQATSDAMPQEGTSRAAPRVPSKRYNRLPRRPHLAATSHASPPPSYVTIT